MRLKKAASIAGLTVTIAVTNSFAFVPALPVFDATVWGEQLLQTVKLIAQLRELENIFEKAKDHLKHATDQAEWVRGRMPRYRIPNVPQVGVRVSNVSERLNTWIGAINAGIDVSQTWKRATVSITHFPGGWGSIPAQQRTNRQIDLAGIELADGVAESAMEVIGRIRKSRETSALVIYNLQNDALGDERPERTEAAELQKANAIAIAQTQEMANANQIAAANAEMLLLRMKAERDAAAKAYASEVARRTQGPEAWGAMTSGMSDSMRNFRLTQ